MSDRRQTGFFSGNCRRRTIGTIADIAEGLAKNSLDAGARKVEISFSLQHFAMSCEDDGCGLAPQVMETIAEVHRPRCCRTEADPFREGSRKDGGFLVAVANCSHLDIVSQLGYLMHDGAPDMTEEARALLSDDAKSKSAKSAGRVILSPCAFSSGLRREN